MDLEEDFGLLSNQGRFMKLLNLEFGLSRGIVFIDEIQRIENAGKFLKGIYDTLDNVKFVISGSGSIELKEKIVESLAGRKRIFSIKPISFDEFIDYKTAYTYSDRLQTWKDLNVQKTLNYWEEYALYGGYPASVTASSAEDKRIVLSEIMNSYLHRDVRELLSIQNHSAYNQLFKILSRQVGYTVKYSQLAQYVTISSRVVKDYIWYMNHTYMIYESKPYFTNPLKEIVKEPILYFYDLGMLNLQRNNLVPETGLPSFGMVFQNFVHNELAILFVDYLSIIKYWRTKDRAEVDLILDLGFGVFPIEVKYSDNVKPSITRSFRGFLEKYCPKSGFVITKATSYELLIHDTKVYFLPFYRLHKIKQILLDDVN